MEKEYAVVVKAGVDLKLFDAELLATTGAGPVPNRSVAIANPRLGSKRMTHWMLTDEEVTELNQDDRVLSIEIPIDQRDDIQIGLHKTQSDKLFTRSSGINETWANWGLRRCIEQTNVYNNSSAAPDNNFDYAVDGSGVDVVIQDSGLQVDHPEFMIAGSIDSEYNNGAISNLVGNGSSFFSREVTVNGVRIVAAGAVGGQTAVPDAWTEKVARMFELFTDKTGASINETSQRTFIKTLRGDAGTYHAAQGPTLQRVARGAGSDYTPNFLTDEGIASYNLSPLFDSHAANDMVWYLNSTGDGYGDGDIDAQEVIEHVFHTLHMHGLDAVSLKMYAAISSDWATGPLYNAMVEAYDGGFWDPSGYGGSNFKTVADAFEVAAKEYLYLLNFCMFEYTSLWDGDSLAPEWTDNVRTASQIQTNLPLGYALFNSYIAPVISKPSIATINSIFGDGNTPAQDNPALAGVSGYVVSTAGTSRVQQIDWYTASGLSGTQSVNHYRDWDGHGTHVAGITAGKTYGWAKGAHIYSQKLAGLEFDGNTGISITDAFDTIRLWHDAKPIDPATGFKRPTVVNMSWGYSTTRSGAPDSGTYRGVDWNYDIDYTTRLGLWSGVGYTPDYLNSGTSQRVPVRVASVDAEIEDMISQGIHVCIAAGNNLYKAELLGGVDYDNTVTFGGTTTNYHRGSSPYSDNAFMVGNLDTTTFNDGGTFRDKTAFSSTRGPGVNIWAPGTSIVSACSTTNQFGSSSISSPEDSNFRILSIGGTSMAAPQVAGVVAQHLQVRPDLTPAQMQDRINGEALEVIYTTDSTTDYSTNESILGASNRHLYSRYGVANPVTMPLSALTFTGLRLKLD